ncbi:hypothetical protein KYE_09183 [Marinobacter manganoxydans MnI7-9]|uniref:Uncharacterized protein n=1 Tax=Marinobacter manganoxydans MnI7-9 TaxID=1094979 RepID=G6YSJ6_9GAMM|nr:hypothetical protein KYE_09183 [Marinobacter manganoxydans MnI7-9]
MDRETSGDYQISGCKDFDKSKPNCWATSAPGQ